MLSGLISLCITLAEWMYLTAHKMLYYRTSISSLVRCSFLIKSLKFLLTYSITIKTQSMMSGLCFFMNIITSFSFGVNWHSSIYENYYIISISRSRYFKQFFALSVGIFINLIATNSFVVRFYPRTTSPEDPVPSLFKSL